MLATRIKQWECEIAEKGREEGQKEILTKMLVLKFGPLPDWAGQLVQQADVKLLDRWLENIFNADSLAAVLKLPE